MQFDLSLPITLMGFDPSRANTTAGMGKPFVTDHHPKTVTHADTDKALHDLDKSMRPYDISLKFTRDEDTGTIVVEMIDQESGEKLRQIPNETSLHVAASLSKFQGRIIDCKA
jgi:flagellar protein FlaG